MLTSGEINVKINSYFLAMFEAVLVTMPKAVTPMIALVP